MAHIECEEEVIGGKCQECGAGCEPNESICLHCATANAASEARVNDFMDERFE